MSPISLLNPSELSAADIARWRELQLLNPQLHGPFFHPHFIQAVAKIRPGVEVAVIRQQGEAVGFFPFHRDLHGAGQPAAGLLSDFEGLIQAPGLRVDPQQLLNGCGLRCWRFNHLLTDQEVFAGSHYSLSDSPYIEMTEDFDQYKQNRAAAGSQVVKRTQQKLRKLSRRVGPLRLELNAPDESTLEQLLRWKSQQYRSAGLIDLFEFQWVKDLLREMLTHQGSDFGGVLTTLHAGSHLVAATFSLRTGNILHPWFPAYAPEYSLFSPGSVLLIELIRQAPADGIRRIDLGRGEERYKRRFQTGATIVAQGCVERNYVTHLVRKTCHRAYNWLRTSPLRKPLRVPGRLIKNLTERAALK